MDLSKFHNANTVFILLKNQDPTKADQAEIGLFYKVKEDSYLFFYKNKGDIIALGLKKEDIKQIRFSFVSAPFSRQEIIDTYNDSIRLRTGMSLIAITKLNWDSDGNSSSEPEEEPEDPHKGMVYNAYNDTWHW